MNKHEVYIVTDDDEVYLGTVGEIIGTDRWVTDGAGRGISLAAVFSDIVGAIAWHDGPQTFKIELRERES